MMHYLKRLTPFAFVAVMVGSACSENKTSSTEKTEIKTMDSTSQSVKDAVDKLDEQTKKVEESLEKLDNEFKSNN